jgi:hypothetical protein
MRYLRRQRPYGFSAHYPNDRFIAQVVFREIQENFKPAIGFVQRDNVRLFRAAGSYNPRPKKLLNIQQMNHDVFFTRFTRLDNNQVESQDLYVTWWDWHFKSGDNMHAMVRLQPDLRAPVRDLRDFPRRGPDHLAMPGSRVSGATCSRPRPSGPCRAPSLWRGATTGPARRTGDHVPHV